MSNLASERVLPALISPSVISSSRARELDRAAEIETPGRRPGQDFFGRWVHKLGFLPRADPPFTRQIASENRGHGAKPNQERRPATAPIELLHRWIVQIGSGEELRFPPQSTEPVPKVGLADEPNPFHRSEVRESPGEDTHALEAKLEDHDEAFQKSRCQSQHLVFA